MSYMKDWFTEDEDDIFMGSPKSKFFDISRQANDEIVEDEMDKIIERYAAMELMLSQDKGEDFDINKLIAQFIFENGDEIAGMKKGLYIEFTGDIVCRLDS